MYPKEIPDFIDDVMKQIEIGISRVHKKRLEEIVGEGSFIHVSYPEVVEIMLNVEAKVDDGSEDGAYEHQTIWVKIPWPHQVHYK